MAEQVVEEKVEVKPDGTEVTTQVVEETVERAPNPQDNPRNAILASIAKEAFKQHDAEAGENSKIPVTDEDNAPVAAAPSETEDSTPPEQEEQPPSSEAEPSASAAGEQPPPASKPREEAVGEDKEYDVVVEGQKMKVSGKALIEAGIRTFQKETAADFRLRTASQLLEEAERRMAEAKPAEVKPTEQPAPAGEPNEAQLAEMLQFGTKEQSAQAVKVLLQRGTEPGKILQLAGDAARAAVRDELEFARGKSLIQREFGDLMAKEPLRDLFFSMEGRLRDAGDKRPYADLYLDIGAKIRKDFNLPKPAAKSATPTVQARVERKAKAPSVPKTATARLEAAPVEKPRSTSDTIAAMAAARGKNRLTQPTRKE